MRWLPSSVPLHYRLLRSHETAIGVDTAYFLGTPTAVDTAVDTAEPDTAEGDMTEEDMAAVVIAAVPMMEEVMVEEDMAADTMTDLR